MDGCQDVWMYGYTRMYVRMLLVYFVYALVIQPLPQPATLSRRIV